MSFNPLNPTLYNFLKTKFGAVKVEKQGQALITSITKSFGKKRSNVDYSGETYRVNCPVCGDTKQHLYVNYAFGEKDPKTGTPIYLATCFRCGPKVKYLKDLLQHTSFKKRVKPIVLDVPQQEKVEEVFVSPGKCVRLDKNIEAVKEAREYLESRDIDPDEAAKKYGVSFCVEGNKELWGGILEGRLIVPVILGKKLIGWQARLIDEPDIFHRDTSLKTLRWISMPGSGWRARNLFGFNEAAKHNICYVVEGPTDVLKQGPPCVGTLGQTVSSFQADLIAKTWSAKPDAKVVLIGDPPKSENSSEVMQQKRSLTMLSRVCVCPVYHVELPVEWGDPGDCDREEFHTFVDSQLKALTPFTPPLYL